LVNKRKGDLEKAKEYYEQALQLNKKVNNSPGMAENYNNLGALFEKKKDWARAIEYYQQALKLDMENDHPEAVAVSHSNLGHVYEAMDIYEQALHHYRIAKRINQWLGKKARAAQDQKDISRVGLERVKPR